MGFAVLHIQKPKGNDSGTTAHIERAVNPANADLKRKHLNQNLIEYPDGWKPERRRYSTVSRTQE